VFCATVGELVSGESRYPQYAEEGKYFAYSPADTDVSVHCNFVLSHCGPTPKLNYDPVDVFLKGFATRHGNTKARSRTHVLLIPKLSTSASRPQSVLKPHPSIQLFHFPHPVGREHGASKDSTSKSSLIFLSWCGIWMYLFQWEWHQVQVKENVAVTCIKIVHTT